MLAHHARAGAANMLVPQAYDTGWTELAQAFNETLSPGTVAALTGQAAPAANQAAAAESAVEVTNFPSSPDSPADRDWHNPVAAAMIAIGANSSGMILGANPKRCALTIQNNSASGGATFWIAFGTPAVQYNSIQLAPGAGLVRDARCPRDAVYILITGAAGVTGGVIEEDSYVDSPGGAYVPKNAGAEAWGFVSSPAPAPAPAPSAPLATMWSPPPAVAPSGGLSFGSAPGGDATGTVAVGF